MKETDRINRIDRANGAMGAELFVISDLLIVKNSLYAGPVGDAIEGKGARSIGKE